MLTYICKSCGESVFAFIECTRCSRPQNNHEQIHRYGIILAQRGERFPFGETFNYRRKVNSLPNAGIPALHDLEVRLLNDLYISTFVAGQSASELTEGKRKEVDMNKPDVSWVIPDQMNKTQFNISPSEFSVLADLTGDCSYAMCEYGDFGGLDFRDLRLEHARISQCDFRGVILSSATIRGSHFYCCDFTGANLSGAEISMNAFWHCNGIASLYVPGMSSRGECLYVVKNNPTEFMVKAGCFWGTSEEFIERVHEEKGKHSAYEIMLTALIQAWDREDEDVLDRDNPPSTDGLPF